ncbi:hypothetical protein EDB86DRAFT_3075130 [Lactarius hatsudake]|nr:hypothetical protein EDB86DRAFT_3075130 [Lactarius hatsudake]
MADYNFWFIVKGRDTVAGVTVSKEKRVFDLKKEILEQLCHTYCKGVDAWELVLLKVDIDPALHQGAIHKLHMLHAAEMDTIQCIDEIWTAQPEQHHLHIFETSVLLVNRILSVSPSPLPSGVWQAANNLHNAFWGNGLNDKLDKVLDDDGKRWKYVPTAHRKSSFLYYLLLRLLSEGKPIALQLSKHFLIFQGAGTEIYPNELADPTVVPKGTWALSDSNDRAKQPCTMFLDAAEQHISWIVQTTSPLEERWRDWAKRHLADMFVMSHFSIDEIKMLNLDINNIQCFYKEWGPSAHTCVQLSRNPTLEVTHEEAVKRAASRFIKDPDIGTIDVVFDAITVSHLLFSIKPKANTKRRVPIADIAMDQIRAIISYAAADASARRRIQFYHAISKQPEFRVSAGIMFESFFLSWLSSEPRPNMEPLRCYPAVTGWPDLQIPACREKQTKVFSSLDALKKVKKKALPLCLLPVSRTLPAVDAIVLTDQFIITVQVTLAYRHSVKKDGFTQIEESIPAWIMNGCKWRHTFITDDEATAVALRRQTFSDLPKNIRIYSGVFNVGQSGISRPHMKALNESKKRAHENDNRGEYKVSGTPLGKRARKG